MAVKYYVDQVTGAYLGAYEDAPAPVGGVEVPDAPASATQNWIGAGWSSPYPSQRDAIFARVRTAREIVLNRLDGIAGRAQRAGDVTTANVCDTVSVALLNITTDAGVLAATDAASLELAFENAYKTIVASAGNSANVIDAFSAFNTFNA